MPALIHRTIDIMGQDGTNAFAPNPASASQGEAVIWYNADLSPHRVVMDDGSFDTGEIDPESASPQTFSAKSSGTFHCAIHPTEVGVLNVG